MSPLTGFDKIAVGAEIPSLVKQPTKQQLVMWAGASGDYNPIHYDKDFAQSRGLPGVVVHGQLSTAFICQMLSDWYGKTGSLKKLNVSYKGLNLPGDMLTCHGVVKGKSSDGENLVTLDVWVENQRGEKTAAGTATVSLTS
ncbi:MAG: dehydratase [Dehalococcoidia bacterium]|nr:MAG: dehydratase [Dehalococcoidia bacterium]